MLKRKLMIKLRYLLEEEMVRNKQSGNIYPVKLFNPKHHKKVNNRNAEQKSKEKTGKEVGEEEIINKKPGKRRFFISPEGKIIPVKGRDEHIWYIIAHPEEFGITKEMARRANEEGEHRALLDIAIKKGWMRAGYDTEWDSIWLHGDFEKANPKVRKIAKLFADDWTKEVCVNDEIMYMQDFDDKRKFNRLLAGKTQENLGKTMGKKVRKLRELFNDAMLEESYFTLGFEYLSNVRQIRNHLKVAQQYSEGIVTSKMEGASDDMIDEFQQISNDIAEVLERLKKAEENLVNKQDIIGKII